jgi:hypothetical protein
VVEEPETSRPEAIDDTTSTDGSSCAVVAEYLRVAGSADRRRIARLVTRHTASLFADEDWELDEPLTSDLPLVEEPGTTERTTVLVGDVRLPLERRPGEQWRIDRRLSDTHTPVLGARVRLPFGLRPTGAPNTWSRGRVTVRAWRAPMPSPEEFLRALAVEAGADVARSPRVVEEAIGGWRVRSGYWLDPQGSTAVAVVDDGAAVPLWWAHRSRGVGGSGYELLSPMIESLESDARSSGRAAPASSPRVSRELSEGYSLQAAEADRVESETFAATDLEAAIERARVRDGEVLSELRVPGAVLPWRALYRVRGEWDNERAVRFSMVGVGFDEGLGVVVTVSAPAVTLDTTAELSRLTSIIDSVRPLPPERLWPDVSPIGEALPFGASGSIRPPRGWRRSLKHNDEKWVTWSGYGGDSIEVIVAGRDETILGGEKVLVQPIGDGRRVLTICAYAATPARRERVAAVARACAATLQLD